MKMFKNLFVKEKKFPTTSTPRKRPQSLGIKVTNRPESLGIFLPNRPGGRRVKK